MPILNRFGIHGSVSAGFEKIRQVFSENFEQRAELGASFCVIHHGQVVVDLWGGSADAKRTKPWQADTLVNVFSTTKGLLALAMHILADRGELDFSLPVRHYWPEFAKNGKATITVGQLLDHTAGLPAVTRRYNVRDSFDWQKMIHLLENSSPIFPPGETCCYHPVTYGWLNGEVLRRITGLMPGEFFRQEISNPLGSDFFCGLREAEIARCADIRGPSVAKLQADLRKVKTENPKAYLINAKIPGILPHVNGSEWRAAQIPAANGHASARGLARMYAPLSLDGSWNGVRILSPHSLKRAHTERVFTREPIGDAPIRFALGFGLPIPDQADPRTLHGFGHGGWGGSYGGADPHNQLALGYVMNRMVEVDDLRFASLLSAVYDCLGNLQP